MTLVAIPVKGRLDLTKSIVSALKADGCVPTVWDNGSEDDTAEWLKERKVPVVNAAGWSLHEMWNDALGAAGGEPVVLLNNDLELDGKPDWIGRLTEHLGEWDALCPNYDKAPVVPWKGPVYELRGICADRYDGTGGLAGFAFALSPSFLASGYRFPEELKWWYGDYDLVATLDREARKYGMVAGCGVTHVGGGSQTARGHDLSEVMERDREAFMAKWGAECTPR